VLHSGVLRTGFFTLLACGFVITTPVVIAEAPAVAVVHSAEWSVGNAAREGAGEFLVLLEAAKLQRTNRSAGLLAVGDHNGILRSGGERALRRLALTGIVVVKLAPQGEVAASPDELYIDAGRMTEAAAGRILTHGLSLYGAPPQAARPSDPTGDELAAIRSHLKKFQTLFALDSASAVALR